jgi:hypothetical protein
MITPVVIWTVLSVSDFLICACVYRQYSRDLILPGRVLRNKTRGRGHCTDRNYR